MWHDKKGPPRCGGPITQAYPCNTSWLLEGTSVSIPGLTIKVLTNTRVYAKALPPPAQLAWELRLGRPYDWHKVWNIKSFFCSPRDVVTWLKVQHRNLWVANRDSSTNGRCNAHGCRQDESILHLAECPIINAGYWNRIRALLSKVGLRSSPRSDFILLGKINRRAYVDQEEAGVLFLAWRCIYAEVVTARLEDKILNLKRAYARCVRLLVSRLKANGLKWYLWFSRTRGIQPKKVKLFPLRYRKRKLITTTAHAEYTINPTLLAEIDQLQA